jgi:hypothetical protein
VASRARRLFLLWLPTALGTSMLVLEIPIVYAAAARSAGGAQVLAALGIGVAVLVVVNSPALAVTPLVITEYGRRPLRHVWRYSLLVGALGTLALVALSSLTPLSALVQLTFGLDDRLLADVRACLLGLAPNSLGVAIRRYLHGRLIVAGRTRPIAGATAVRLAGTAVLAFTATALFPQHGALVAGLALSAGAFSEAAWLAPARGRLPEPVATSPGGGLVRRHRDLSLARLMAMAPMAITTVGIAHAAQATASLVVWPALYELAMLFSSPTSDWESVTAQARQADRRDPTPARLTIWLAAGFTAAFAAVLAGGLAEVYLRALLAIPAAPADLALRWAAWLLPVPALWLARGYLRGTLMADGATGWLSAAGVVHTVVLAMSGLTLTLTDLPGIAVGALAILSGLLSDLAVTLYGTTQIRSPDRDRTGGR